MKLLIRSMITEDIPYVSDLLCECYRWMGETNGFSEPLIKFLLVKRGSVDTVVKESAYESYYVACDGEQIIGMVSIHGNRITKLYVDPKYHNDGVGKRLYDEAERLIAGNGHKSVELGTLGESPVRFYESMGMSVFDMKKTRPDGIAKVDVYLMRKELL